MRSAAGRRIRQESAPSYGTGDRRSRATVEAGFANRRHAAEAMRILGSTRVHRAGPGEAEVHVNDTDIFYVLKGARGN